MAFQIRKGPGGANNKPKPSVDEDVFWRLFSIHEDWMDMGPYETLSKTQACNGEAIAGMFEFVKSILEVAPTGAFAAGPAKGAMSRLVSAKPKVNTSMFSTAVFVGGRLVRINTMMFHLRRIAANEKKYTACAAKCTAGALEKLNDLIKLLDVSLAEEESTATNYFGSQPSERGPPTLDASGFPAVLSDSLEIPEIPDTQEPLEETPAKRRKLKQEPSDVSVDSNGWPRVLCDPCTHAQQTDPRSSRLASLKEDLCTPRSKAKAAGKATPQSKASSKSQPTPKSQASSSQCKAQTQPQDAEEQEFPVYDNCWNACYAKDQSGTLPLVLFVFQASDCEDSFSQSVPFVWACVGAYVLFSMLRVLCVAS